jgi:hypothetical protein
LRLASLWIQEVLPDHLRSGHSSLLLVLLPPIVAGFPFVNVIQRCRVSIKLPLHDLIKAFALVDEVLVVDPIFRAELAQQSRQASQLIFTFGVVFGR